MLDERRFERHLADFVALADKAGLQAWMDGLEAKRRLFARGDPAAMLQSVFTARRKLAPGLAGEIAAHGIDAVSLPEDRKLRGAAQDFAAEVLHFRAPDATPLKTRWATDALREFDADDAVPDADAAHAWLRERIAAQGIYRDLHWWADLTLGMAYVDYLRAMTGGVLGADFSRALTPEEQLSAILGLKVVVLKVTHGDP